MVDKKVNRRVCNFVDKLLYIIKKYRDLKAGGEEPTHPNVEGAFYWRRKIYKQAFRGSVDPSWWWWWKKKAFSCACTRRKRIRKYLEWKLCHYFIDRMEEDWWGWEGGLL